MSISIIGQTISGQADPTARAALGKIMLEEKTAQKAAVKQLMKLYGAQEKKGSASLPTTDALNWARQMSAQATPDKAMVLAVIKAAYQDYVDVLRTLEEIPEPAEDAKPHTKTRHKNRINSLKERMENLEEFFYSPLYAWACNVDPDILVNRAWKEAYNDD